MRPLPRQALWKFNVVCFCTLALIATSCGGCDDERGNGQQGNNAVRDTGGATDGGTEGDSGADAGDDSGIVVDMARTDADAGGVVEGDTCGAYGTVCDGACISTIGDPDNCGGCGVVCSAAEVCLGGQCVESCLPGLEACDRTCVDLANDSAHCDACNNPCAPGTGCVSGDCVDAIDVDFDAVDCTDGGPPIDLGGDVREDQQCAANLAELTFRYGVCSCQNFATNNPVTVDAYDSQLGPYIPGGLGGGIGVNGNFDGNNDVDLTGTLWVAGAVESNNGLTIGQSMLVGGNADVGSGSIGRSAFVGGDITGDWAIASGLYLPPGQSPPGSVTYGQLFNQAIAVPPPCTECPPNHIDVAGLVATFGGNNDNALIGLDPDALNPTDGTTRLDLPCGRYYLTGIDTTNPVTIVAHGQTALFIEGDVASNNPLTITLTPNAQLDIFVSGNFSTNNALNLGSPNYPALLRLYIGGPEGFATNNQVTLSGYLYAVPGSIRTNNKVEVYGGLYSNDVSTNNEWNIHYDRRVTTIGDSCEGSGGGSGNNGTNNGTGGGSGNDICTTQGGMCADSGDCCSPLTCEDGVCSLLDCVPSNGACSSSSECCRGACSSATDGICVIQ